MATPNSLWPTRLSVVHHAPLLLLLSIGVVRPATAQFLEKAEFEGGIERAAIDGPRRQWNHPTYCRLVIDLNVSRDGKVLSAAVNVPLSSCSDTALVNKANALARTYVFTPNAQAPEPQAARFTWGIGERQNHEDVLVSDHEAVLAPEPMLADPSSANEPYAIVEEMPQFPGGAEALYPYIRKNLKFPEKAVEHGVEGVVYLTFVVEKDGSISNPKLLRGIGYGCDEEALRVVKGMPNWTPGKQGGEAVRVQYNLPIRFKL